MGYLLDIMAILVSIAMLALTFWKASGISIDDWSSLFAIGMTQDGKEDCDTAVIRFGLVIFIIHGIYVIFLLLLVTIGCFRKDATRDHDIFDEKFLMAKGLKNLRTSKA